MPVTLHSMLSPTVILDVASRIRPGQGRIGRHLGFHYGLDAKEKGTMMGPNTKETPTRSGTYDIFDLTRTVAKGRAPGTGPATIAPQPVGQANYTCARFHEKIPLDYEKLANMRPIGGPSTQIDAGGQQYVAEQTKFLSQRFNNAIEVMVAGLVRGKLYLKASGDDLIPVLTAPSAGYVEIDFKLASGNQSQLNMLGSGSIIDVSWANPAAKIISKHLPDIVDAYVALNGVPPTDFFVNPRMWGYIQTNTEVVNSGGSAQTPFSEFGYVGDKLSDGTQAAEMVAVLRGYPMIKWHVVMDRLVLDGTDTTYAAGTGTLTKVLPENDVLIMPEVSSEWVDLLHYSEHVAAAPGLPAVKRPSFYLWTETRTQPSTIDLLALLNAIPRLRVPKCLARGTMVF
jgi:hypothetical protein